jgi:hypothetical protein
MRLGSEDWSNFVDEDEEDSDRGFAGRGRRKDDDER